MTFAVIFTVCLLVSLAIIAFIAKRNRDPRFRPRFGELVLMFIVSLVVCGGVSYLLSSLFEGADGMSKMGDAPRFDRPSSPAKESDSW